MPRLGKTSPLKSEHFEEFVKCFGDDAYGKAKRKDLGEEGRYRKFSRDFIRERDESLDIAWLKDEALNGSANLPAPEVLAQEAMIELEGAMIELRDILEQLGVEEVEE